ncbi:MAG: hypothetical protein C0600_15740 [Ignavibacteria bacterium]|nr:MAG: hypothetical protein C0600_15740 [Ignavibacteria bacterium]
MSTSPGTVIPLDADDFSCVDSPSPLYAGLPDRKKLAANCGIPFPRDIRILAMEVEDPYSIGAPMTPAVVFSLQEYVRSAHMMLQTWFTSSGVLRAS